MAEVNIALSRLQAENPLFTHRDVGNPEPKVVCRRFALQRLASGGRKGPSNQA
jgi:hypothetical protein